MLLTRLFVTTMDRGFDRCDLPGRTAAAERHAGAARPWAPAMDLLERPDAYLIAVELPGVDPATVEVQCEPRALTIRGTTPEGPGALEDAQHRVRERVTGAFARTLRLSDAVDADAVQAEFAHGLLLVTVPKARSAQPRRIEVRTRA